jgi:membrane protease YdiL (CAAX protease family)
MNTAILGPCIISSVSVAAWVACGWIFHLGTVSYCLIGIPFVVAFQIVICRRPIHQLWVHDAKSFHLDRIGIILAIAIIAGQAVLFWRLLLPWHIWGALFLFLVILGSVGFAYALRQQRADRFRQALPSFAVAVFIGCIFVWTHKHSLTLSPSMMPALLKNFIRVLPYVFVIDEVVFRGLLDSYVASSTGSRRAQWISAIFVSALWGFWHMWHTQVLPDFALTLALGVPLSFCWRKSGTLLLPGVAHALINAYRDTILYGPAPAA